MTRVGVIGPVFPDSFADNVISSIRAMGHDAISLGVPRPTPSYRILVAVVDAAERISRLEAAFQSALVRRTRSAQPEIVLSLEGTLMPSTVRAIKAGGARVGLWFPDAVSNLGRQLMYLSPYDATFFKDPLLVERSQRFMDRPVYFVPEACNPEWHAPPPGTSRVPVAVVAGNMYGCRVRLLDRLHAAGIPLRLYGPPPPRWLVSPVIAACHSGRYIVRQEKARVFREAAVLLNSLHPAEMESVNCRLFEAAGCGAAIISEHRLDLPNFFEVHKEVEVFHGFDDLVDQTRWMLDHPDESRAMGDRATARAHADHSYRQRLQTILQALA